MNTSKHSIPSGHPALPVSVQSRMQRGASLPSNASVRQSGIAPVPGSVQSTTGSSQTNPVHQRPMGSKDATSTTGAHNSAQSASVSQLAHRSGGTPAPVVLDEPAELDPLASLVPTSEAEAVEEESPGPCESAVDASGDESPVVSEAALPLAAVGSLLVEPMSSAGTHCPATSGFPSSP